LTAENCRWVEQGDGDGNVPYASGPTDSIGGSQ